MAVVTGAVGILLTAGSLGQALELPFFGQESRAQDASSTDSQGSAPSGAPSTTASTSPSAAASPSAATPSAKAGQTTADPAQHSPQGPAASRTVGRPGTIDLGPGPVRDPVGTAPEPRAGACSFRSGSGPACACAQPGSRPGRPPPPRLQRRLTRRPPRQQVLGGHGPRPVPVLLPRHNPPNQALILGRFWTQQPRSCNEDGTASNTCRRVAWAMLPKATVRRCFSTARTAGAAAFS